MCTGQLVINEIADKGVDGTCDGEDYIEFKNLGDELIDLNNYSLYDDKGPDHEDRITLTTSFEIQPGGLLVLCGDAQNSFQFGIGGDDTVFVLDPNEEMVDSVGPLPGFGSSIYPYQRTDDGEYLYATPTPGEENAFQDPEVVINEVSTGGVNNACGGEAYVELHNLSPNPVTMEGYSLSSTETSTLSAELTVGALDYLLLCSGTDFDISISAGSSVVLENGGTSTTSGDIPSGISGTQTFQRKQGDGSYELSRPTPGAPNEFGQVVISEVADKPVNQVCNGEDWVELHNISPDTADISGMLLHDDNGPDDDEAYTIPDGTTILAGEYLILCGVESFAFGIGGGDTVSLLDDDGVVNSSVRLRGAGDETQTFQRREDGTYEYASPTPTSGGAGLSSNGGDVSQPNSDEPEDSSSIMVQMNALLLGIAVIPALIATIN